MRLKKLLKPRSALKGLIIVALLLAAYVFGLFTHLFEQSFANFDYSPSKLDVRAALQTFYQDPDMLRYIEPAADANFTFIHTAELVCNASAAQSSSSPFLVILVKSKVDHFERRDVIRRTWARMKSHDGRPIRTVFLTGLPSPLESPETAADSSHSFHIDLELLHHNAEIVHHHHHHRQPGRRGPSAELYVKDARLLAALRREDTLYRFESECERHGDIVQQNFHDAYYNNTHKTVMGVSWAVESCGATADFYLFVDDDFYLNPRLLVEYLTQRFDQAALDNFYAGFVFPNSSPMRHMLSKWYISLQEYPYDKFPPYASAGFYILSQQSLKQFYVASKLIKRFRFDDIYMGILAYKLGIVPTHMSNVFYHAPTYYPSVYANQIVAAHGFSASELARIWNQLEMFIKID